MDSNAGVGAVAGVARERLSRSADSKRSVDPEQHPSKLVGSDVWDRWLRNAWCSALAEEHPGTREHPWMSGTLGVISNVEISTRPGPSRHPVGATSRREGRPPP